jgi:hypothetical protein
LKGFSHSDLISAWILDEQICTWGQTLKNLGRRKTRGLDRPLIN